ncbi:MAG TPA: right-handed parallel beta-helix repeat-containing protein, partial [Planctomycetota bacterium]|nr:right-handed parallel beta-helix repeat-containing protein [Planctomycetota bacterium]
MLSSKAFTLACLILSFASAELAADVLTVRVDGSGTHPDLQAALDHALPGDTISVGPGDYVLTRPLEARDEKADGVRIVSENGPEETFLSMSSEPEDPNHASIAILEDTYIEIEGLTFRGGLGTLLFPPDDTNFIGTRMGGAVLALEDSSLVFRNCVFEGNGGPANLQGGAIASWDGRVELRDSTLRRNRAWIGGAISSRDGAILLYGSRIESNLASRGGGVASGTESSLFAEQTIFAGNFASGGPTGPGYGGALAGGSDSNNFITNCLFVGNAAAASGGAISSYEDVDDLVVVNSTIVGNASLAGGSIVKENVELRNSIVWDSDGLPIDVDSPVYVSYSAIEGVPLDMLRGEGNIALEPRFVAPGVFDFTRFDGEFPDFIVELGDYRL